MAVKSEQIEKNLVKLTFEVTPEKFEEAIKKAYEKNKGKYSIPGFRKGKVPKAIVEKYYTKAVFYDDAINFVLPDAYEAAIKEADIEPVARPEIDVEEIKDGENIVFTALVTTKPEVTLGDYKGVEIDKIEYTISNEDIDKEIEAVQKKNARLISVEDRAVENGDITIMDFEGFTDGVAFEGGKGTSYELEIGSGSFIPGFEEQMIGMKIDEEKDVVVTFPTEYHAENLAGKEATFKVKVHEIKARELPELDDDFASEVSEFETFAEYKDSIKKKLQEAAENRTKAETENAIVKAVVDNAEVEIPEAMIDAQINNMIQDFSQRLMYQGLNLETYLKMSGMNIDQMKAQFKDQAETQVKTTLTLEAVGKAEGIEVGDEEYEMHIIDMAKQYNMESDKLKEMIHEEEANSIKKEMIITKSVQMIVNNAVIK